MAALLARSPLMELNTRQNFTQINTQVRPESAKNQTTNSTESLQDAFKRFRKKRQEKIKQSMLMEKKALQGRTKDSEKMEALRMKFLEQAKSYIGVPYAKRYHGPDSPYHNAPLYLDCCGLVRKVLRDLKEDFGFYVGPWNQAYQYDTLPISLDSVDQLKPGDLVFVSGIYYNPKSKKQKHNMVHVEIWLGDGEKTLGARWQRKTLAIHDSYQYVSKSYHSMKYHFKSIDTWLMGICKSFCPEHAWKESKYEPGKKSIFALDDEEDQEAQEAAEDEDDGDDDDYGSSQSHPISQSHDPTTVPKFEAGTGCGDDVSSNVTNVLDTILSGTSSSTCDHVRSTQGNSSCKTEQIPAKVETNDNVSGCPANTDLVEGVLDATDNLSRSDDSSCPTSTDLNEGVTDTGDCIHQHMCESSSLQTSSTSLECLHLCSHEEQNASCTDSSCCVSEEREVHPVYRTESERGESTPGAVQGVAMDATLDRTVPFQDASQHVPSLEVVADESKANTDGKLFGTNSCLETSGRDSDEERGAAYPLHVDEREVCAPMERVDLTSTSFVSRPTGGQSDTNKAGRKSVIPPKTSRTGIGASRQGGGNGNGNDENNDQAAPRKRPPVYSRARSVSTPELTYYIGGHNGASLVDTTMSAMGWSRLEDKLDHSYKLRWTECKSQINYNEFREGEQLVNHIPNGSLLTTKIGLMTTLKNYERLKNKVKVTKTYQQTQDSEDKPSFTLDFLPETYKLDSPLEKQAFIENVYKEGETWICKPTGMNQGKGIFLVRTMEELTSKLITPEENGTRRRISRPPPGRIIQRYISNPLLLDGFKFDIRTYMLIASTVPYVVMYHHGYVRLSCIPYSLDADVHAHLTNQYIQKKHPLYSSVKENTVWNFQQLQDYIDQHHTKEKGLAENWVFSTFTKRMQQIMMTCFKSVQNRLERKAGFFDLLGFDFMIDEDFKVWLLEINVNPALHTNCQVLKDVIPDTVDETLKLVVEIFDKKQKKKPVFPLENLKDFVVLFKEGR